MGSTDDIKYLTELSAQKFIKAGMLFIIVFLVGIIGTLYYSDRERGLVYEKEKTEIIRDCAQGQINQNNARMRIQDEKIKMMDSTAAAANDQLIKIREFLESKKTKR